LLVVPATASLSFTTFWYVQASGNYTCLKLDEFAFSGLLGLVCKAFAFLCFLALLSGQTHKRMGTNTTQASQGRPVHTIDAGSKQSPAFALAFCPAR